MSNEFTEDDMRKALGLDTGLKEITPPTPVLTITSPKPETSSRIRRPSPALRVLMRVSKEFEGEQTLFTHDAKTLSRFEAEQQAKKVAMKEKYKYMETVSITAIE